MRLIFSIFLFGLLAACTDSQILPENESAPPKQQVFAEDFDRVWKAVQTALIAYPVRVNDLEAGVLETDFIKGDALWTSPFATKRTTGGTRYKIYVNVLKGKLKESQKATRVTVTKRIENQRDFFSPTESLGSDGFEESSIMYRIEREIQIERALAKVKRS